jgi:hypothetical protein
MEPVQFGWALPGDVARALRGDRAAMARVWWTFYGYWILHAEFERAGIDLPGPEFSGEAGGQSSSGQRVPAAGRIPWLLLLSSRLWNLLGPIDPAPFDLSDRAMMFALTANTGNKGGFEQINKAGLTSLAEKLREIADRIALDSD